MGSCSVTLINRCVTLHAYRISTVDVLFCTCKQRLGQQHDNAAKVPLLPWLTEAG
jgi:hypothetical protein